MICCGNEQIYTLDPKTNTKEFALKPLFGTEFCLHDLDVLETLGTGTFGRVRLARRISDKKYYALKIMKKAKIVRLRQLKHIQNEVKILSHLDSKFIVNMPAFFQDENNIYILLQYVPGGELYSHLRKKTKFNESLSRFYTAEIASAIDHMHKFSIAYRDIKPENILIDVDGHIKITDFGFAKIVNDITYTLCGTPEYLAPEIVQGTGHGRAVDWWALGVLLFEMIAGYPPFSQDNPFGVYQMILKARISFPKNTSLHVQTAIRGFLTVDRKLRLGCKKGGLLGLRKLAFFKGVNWVAVAQQQLVPPFKPVVSSDGDTSNFDNFPDEEIDEVTNLSAADRAAFEEFEVIVGRRVAVS